MKENIFNVENDINTIECEFACADVSVEEAADGIFKIEYPAAKNVHIGSGESGLFINQKKRLFGGKQRIKIFVPSHVIPSIKINGKSFDFLISGGIYGELNLNADRSNVYLSSCVFENVGISGGEINATLDCATLKSGLLFSADKGEVLAENTFSTRAEFRLKRGNVGLVNLNCRECTFEAEQGNMTATMAGSEEDFNTSLITKEGTVNRESAKRDGAENTFQAYAGKGNIVLDFTSKREDN